ncbi:cytochrome P450 monooxygenase-like protein [Dendryphion nanum]|uniref:Cytochrome P450 monooxygenase-like protein n=1 Tax=Dendryphion nanum TaxID=256645 RepID=A0A9P9E3P2_9PLEO|nr:cytochrome P450 monooxygenase-like protein [Dendryphion nanum]
MTFLLPLSICMAASYVLGTAIYNLFFHPLRHVPGPLLSRMSTWPSFYHACKGDRHIWAWQQFQIYGRRFRAAPDVVLFNSYDAFDDIYAVKANVKRSGFYSIWVRNENDVNTLSCTDNKEHMRKRKLLNTTFTERSLRAAEPFMVAHIDRWNQLQLGTQKNDDEWSSTHDLSHSSASLFFDLLGDLAFGAQFNTKEPGPNKLKEIPHFMEKYMQFLYPIAKSPIMNQILWLKPRGLNAFLEAVTPKGVKAYFAFLEECVDKRLESEKKREITGAVPERPDMFHFLHAAKNPETGGPALSRHDIIAECNLLIVAATDTTAVSTSAFMFFITHHPRVYEKVVREIRTTFNSADEIVQGQLLSSCTYLRACIDETMRLAPSGGTEFPREVLPGGQVIDGDYYPPGTILGTHNWSLGRQETVYGDSHTFRPERWLVSPPTDSPDSTPEPYTVTIEDVRTLKRQFAPFLKGTGRCLGENVAILQLSMCLARTLWRMDVRQAPGLHVGAGSPEQGWGRSDPNLYITRDAYITIRDGPMVQFKKRAL